MTVRSLFYRSAGWSAGQQVRVPSGGDGGRRGDVTVLLPVHVLAQHRGHDTAVRAVWRSACFKHNIILLRYSHATELAYTIYNIVNVVGLKALQ